MLCSLGMFIKLFASLKKVSQQLFDFFGYLKIQCDIFLKQEAIFEIL